MAPAIRDAGRGDHAAIDAVLRAAFGGVPWARSPAFQALALRPGERIAGEVRYAGAFGPMTGGQGSAP